ncbi:MAG: class I SAM-dependent methyltransferase [bacterium]|nr:class I SAM-dependent methyltransferase [bacterium]
MSRVLLRAPERLREDDRIVPGQPAAREWNRFWAASGILIAIIASGRALFHVYHRRLLHRYVKWNGRVLEIGSGSGSLLLSIAPRVAEVVGLDSSAAALAQARAEQARRGVTNARFLLGDCRAVPFEQMFDVVWSAGLIEHFFERDIDVVRQHVKAATHRGYILVSVPHAYSIHRLHYALTRLRPLRHFWPWSSEDRFQRFYTRSQLAALGARLELPYRVFFLPPAPLGVIFGLVILEIRKGEAGTSDALGEGTT